MNQVTKNAVSMDSRLRPTERLRRRADFQAAFDAKARAAGAAFILFGRKNGMEISRLGISIGRRYGNAVARNRFKRICREAFRLSKALQPSGYDWVVVPQLGLKRRPGTPAPDLPPPRLDSFQKEMVELMQRVACRRAPLGNRT